MTLYDIISDPDQYDLSIQTVGTPTLHSNDGAWNSSAIQNASATCTNVQN